MLLYRFDTGARSIFIFPGLSHIKTIHQHYHCSRIKYWPFSFSILKNCIRSTIYQTKILLSSYCVVSLITQLLVAQEIIEGLEHFHRPLTGFLSLSWVGVIANPKKRGRRAIKVDNAPLVTGDVTEANVCVYT